ncbi:hypothetical protein M9458_024508, partial [Cirrhinus mrigala]
NDPDLIPKKMIVELDMGLLYVLFPPNNSLVWLWESGLDMFKMNCHHPPWWKNG